MAQSKGSHFTRAGRAGSPVLALISASANARFLAFCFSTRQRVASAVGFFSSSLSFRCNAILDRFSRKVVGWAVDRTISSRLTVAEVYFGKQMKFITVVSNLDTGKPLLFGQDRKTKHWMSFSGRN
jgi:hypothetical protein